MQTDTRPDPHATPDFAWVARLIPASLRNPATRLELLLTLGALLFVFGPPAVYAVGYTAYGGGGADGGTPADPIVPLDGTQNITGGLSVSSRVDAIGGLDLANGVAPNLSSPLAGQFQALANVADSGTAVAHILNNNSALSNAAARLLSVRNNGTEKLYGMYDGALGSKSTMTSGTITLSGGTGTATVLSGAKCVCSEVTDATKTVGCAVSTTTLTATGTGTDSINYVCIGQ